MMPVMNFDLEDGLPPVSFSLKDEDCERMIAFMAECTEALDHKRAIRVHGWVWKDKRYEEDMYVPAYTPAQHVPKGELFALVDPADLHEPLENTVWY
jgi:hypothetical protein